jgi:hypothetical protein
LFYFIFWISIYLYYYSIFLFSIDIQGDPEELEPYLVPKNGDQKRRLLKKYDKICCRKTFDKIFDNNNKFKIFSLSKCYTDMCKVCEDGNKCQIELERLLDIQEKTEEDLTRINELQLALEALNYHKEQKDLAKRAFEEAFKRLGPGDALIVCDFKGIFPFFNYFYFYFFLFILFFIFYFLIFIFYFLYFYIYFFLNTNFYFCTELIETLQNH